MIYLNNFNSMGYKFRMCMLMEIWRKRKGMFVLGMVEVRISCFVKGRIVSFKVCLIILIWLNLKKESCIEQIANYLKSNIGKD